MSRLAAERFVYKPTRDVDVQRVVELVLAHTPYRAGGGTGMEGEITFKKKTHIRRALR